LSSERNYEKLLIASSIIGSLGAVQLIVGIILILTQTTLSIQELAILVFVINILIICLTTFFGALPAVRFTFKDERPALVSLLLFLFAPFTLISKYTTPLYYFIETKLNTGTFSVIHYLSLVGIAFLLLSFMFYSWIFFWKLSQRSSQATSSEIPIAKASGLSASGISIVAIIGIIVGLALPAASTGSSLLLSAGTGTQLSFSALTFLVYLVTILTTAFVVFLSHFDKVNLPRTDTPLLFMLFTFLALPGYAPPSASESIWSSPVYKLLEYGIYIFNDMTTIGWILIISVLIGVFAFLLVGITYFLKISATVEEKPVLTPSVTSSTTPTSHDVQTPPAAGSSPLGSLADTLAGTTQSPPAAISSGSPPTVSSGPPSAVPSVGSQSSPPSFGITTQKSPTLTPTKPITKEKPTCPFCGKELSFIEEYQRWYCYNCSQYV